MLCRRADTSDMQCLSARTAAADASARMIDSDILPVLSLSRCRDEPKSL